MSYTYNETRTPMPSYDEGNRTKNVNDIIFVSTLSDKVNTDDKNESCNDSCSEHCNDVKDKSLNVNIKRRHFYEPKKIMFDEQMGVPSKKEENSIFNTDNLNIVEHPNHYGAGNGGLQCIEAMLQTFGKTATMDFCKLNAFKYIWRSDHKDKEIQDMEKAKRYLEYWHVLVKLKGNSDDGTFHDYLNN